jgi:hypothetical protein
MKIRETPMRVNKKTTAFDLLEYLTDLEEVLDRGGRVVALPERALVDIKAEFFEVRNILQRPMEEREIPEIDGDLDGLVVRMTKEEMRKLFAFIDHVGKVLRHFEVVGGELPDELPPERVP